VARGVEPPNVSQLSYAAVAARFDEDNIGVRLSRRIVATWTVPWKGRPADRFRCFENPAPAALVVEVAGVLPQKQTPDVRLPAFCASSLIVVFSQLQTN